jgi:hypothetical protein
MLKTVREPQRSKDWSLKGFSFLLDLAVDRRKRGVREYKLLERAGTFERELTSR